MARVEEAIYNILSNDATITGYTSQRIYPMIIPQDAILPALCYERVSTMRHFSMSQDPNIAQTSIDVTVVSSSLGVANTIAEAVRNCLNRHTGSHASMIIDDIWIEDEREYYFQDIFNYEMILSFGVLHRETTS
jgi:hypothetical protein